MPVVPGFEHDVFVSYAHLDDAPSLPAVKGWVHTFVEKLESEVRQRLGTREFGIWIDHRLDENRPLTPQILATVEGSATLLVVLSPGYLHSPWCERERRAFLGVLERRVQEGCVFLVETRRLERKALPPEFGDLVPFKLWTTDADGEIDRPLGVPDVNEPAYISRINALSYKVKKQLDHLVSARTNPHRATVARAREEAGPWIFVAQATEDLEEREDDLREYLAQLGFNVLPRTRYLQSEAEAYESAMLRDLERCKLFVQLLSASKGRRVDFDPSRRHPAFQRALAERAGKPLLVWRDRVVKIDEVTDDEHRAALEAARACNIEEFKRAVATEARRAPAERPRTATNVMVFVNADSPDEALAKQVGRMLAEQGIECYWPLRASSPESIREDLEENLRVCDGVLLVYGATGADWVRSQLRQGRKVIAMRDRPLSALAVVEGPPPEKSDIGAAIPNLVVLDCRGGIDTSGLARFVDALRS